MMPTWRRCAFATRDRQRGCQVTRAAAEDQVGRGIESYRGVLMLGKWGVLMLGKWLNLQHLLC
jgi:hypothetical protein